MAADTEPTNYDRVFIILRALSTVKMSSACWTVLIYLIDQQYQYLKQGNYKDGDSVGYGHLAQALQFSKPTVKRAVKWLAEHNIITYERYATKFGNMYHINENPYAWKIPEACLRLLENKVLRLQNNRK